MTEKREKTAIEDLLEIMRKLRDPENGCPWDIEQTFESIAPYTIEEAYEVADAIERKDRDAILNELGDLLFQVVFYAQMAEEDGDFTFEDIAATVVEKMIRRHPHVFGESTIKTAEEQTEAWEEFKAEERQQENTGKQSVLDGIALALPALMRSEKIQKRAARVGFDWPSIAPVKAKIEEELEEVSEAVQQRKPEEIEKEIGDLLFSVVNLARHLKVNPESALHHANRKFDARFRKVEQEVQRLGKNMKDMSLEELDQIWTRIKSESKD